MIRDIIVLVPALLGLKGNLEMTLAARLSTQVVLIEASLYIFYIIKDNLLHLKIGKLRKSQQSKSH